MSLPSTRWISYLNMDTDLMDRAWARLSSVIAFFASIVERALALPTEWFGTLELPTQTTTPTRLTHSHRRHPSNASIPLASPMRVTPLTTTRRPIDICIPVYLSSSQLRTLSPVHLQSRSDTPTVPCFPSIALRVPVPTSLLLPPSLATCTSSSHLHEPRSKQSDAETSPAKRTTHRAHTSVTPLTTNRRPRDIAIPVYLNHLSAQITTLSPVHLSNNAKPVTPLRPPPNPHNKPLSYSSHKPMPSPPPPLPASTSLTTPTKKLTPISRTSIALLTDVIHNPTSASAQLLGMHLLQNGVPEVPAGVGGWEDAGEREMRVGLERQSRRPRASDVVPHFDVPLALVQNDVEQQRVPFARPDASHQPDPAEHIAEQAIGRYRECAIEAADRTERERSVDWLAAFLTELMSRPDTLARLSEADIAGVLAFFASIVERALALPSDWFGTLELPTQSTTPTRLTHSHRRHPSSASIPLASPTSVTPLTTNRRPLDIAIPVYLNHLFAQITTLSPVHLQSILPILFRALAFYSSPLPRLSINDLTQFDSLPLEREIVNAFDPLLNGPYASCLPLIPLSAPASPTQYPPRSIRSAIQSSTGAIRALRLSIRRTLCARLARSSIARMSSDSFTHLGAPGQLVDGEEANVVREILPAFNPYILPLTYLSEARDPLLRELSSLLSGDTSPVMTPCNPPLSFLPSPSPRTSPTQTSPSSPARPHRALPLHAHLVHFLSPHTLQHRQSVLIPSAHGRSPVGRC
ncbi:uncharacterized protein STEHIDRAFT_157255 [Stereum hirsutum FP-91666 SS1]|uniref:uncharacterized protein n=1 Tax=Stereum hirsutum (strain FP-91666) TaxID=721885 RepID=UPI000444A86B|nr:uncharacterized protein STEHIDRAFT_157255 [Stereum hirsutum FP-91666 SS1]EIM86969.1 hypothetical protein STEHIDRAFT_157255 [Stereum hirsutum FP-91666 SS1]